MPSEALKSLLDPALIARLDQLELATNRVFRGRQRGERRSKRKGVSIEFADYRDYSRGDDTRHLDWNIFGRLERLFIKLYQEEEDLAFYLILDTSKSMDFGTPMTKFDYARRLAAALGYIALGNQDKVGVTVFDERAQTGFRPARGKGQLPKFLSHLAGLEPGSGTALVQSCRDFILQNRQSGVVVLITDFLDPAGHEAALKHFLQRNYEVYCVHVLSPEERKPEMGGHLELIDSESGEKQEVTVSGALLDQYLRTLEAYCNGIKTWCTAHGMVYLPVTTDVALEKMILGFLRMKGLVR